MQILANNDEKLQMELENKQMWGKFKEVDTAKYVYRHAKIGKKMRNAGC